MYSSWKRVHASLWLVYLSYLLAHLLRRATRPRAASTARPIARPSTRPITRAEAIVIAGLAVG